MFCRGSSSFIETVVCSSTCCIGYSAASRSVSQNGNRCIFRKGIVIYYRIRWTLYFHCRYDGSYSAQGTEIWEIGNSCLHGRSFRGLIVNLALWVLVRDALKFRGVVTICAWIIVMKQLVILVSLSLFVRKKSVFISLRDVLLQMQCVFNVGIFSLMMWNILLIYWNSFWLFFQSSSCTVSSMKKGVSCLSFAN